jgi:hypothetical protein
MEWEPQDINKALALGIQPQVAQSERRLTKRDGAPKPLKGQSRRDLEEDDEDEYEYEYDYELEELLDTNGRDLSHLRGKARKRVKRRKKTTKRTKRWKKTTKRYKKKTTKRWKKKGKKNSKNNKKKKQGGRYKNGQNNNNNNWYNNNNNNGGVYDFGTNGVIGNNLHNNLFNDNNRRPVCLQPPDPYRTCYTRTDDPNSKLNVDYIDRSGYNFGVKLYKQQYTYVDPDDVDPAYNTPLEPYARPYTKSNEQLVSGTMWLTLLQDGTTVNCDAQISMEEAVLEYLKDSVGGPFTYEPVCAFVKDWAYDSQKVLDGSDDVVEVTVLEMEITYVVKDSWMGRNERDLEDEEKEWEDLEEFEHPNEENRDLLGGRCTPLGHIMCGSQFSINSQYGQSCRRNVSFYIYDPSMSSFNCISLFRLLDNIGMQRSRQRANGSFLGNEQVQHDCNGLNPIQASRDKCSAEHAKYQ